MTRLTTAGAGGARRSRLGNESGMLLVITMVILLVVSTLAAANLINAFLERSLARNQNYASIALQAADAGLAAGMGWLTDAGNAGKLPGSNVGGNDNTGPPWADSDFDLDSTFPYALALPSGGSSQVTPGLLRDADDRDKDCDYDEIVLFNRPVAVASPPGCDCDAATPAPGCTGADHGKFGYRSSYFFDVDSGFPVIKLASSGRFGASSRELVLEVGRNRFDVKTNGAVTAMGNVSVTGNINIDGTSHDINGNPGGDCSQAFVGVNVPAEQDLDGDGLYTGVFEKYDTDDSGGSGDLDGRASDGSAAGKGYDSVVSNSPDEALGLAGPGDPVNIGGPIDSIITGLPAAGDTKSFGNITYVNDDLDIQSGTGVLIVHNPKFEPKKWYCSAKTVANPSTGPPLIANPLLNKPPAAIPSIPGNICWQRNVAGTDWEPNPNYWDEQLNLNYDGNKYPHLQTNAYVAERRPRNMSGNATTTFKGAVIADQINPINGNLTVIGTMISLSGISINKLGNGSANILFSCDALNVFGSLGYSNKISWHRLYAD